MSRMLFHLHFSCYFINDLPTPQFYTLSLHDALPILLGPVQADERQVAEVVPGRDALRRQPVPDGRHGGGRQDRKSTRLNSSHRCISYAVFCLKKKKKIKD